MARHSVFSRLRLVASGLAATDHESDNHGESDLAATMAGLSLDDRGEAEAEKFCAVMDTSLLGLTGTPLKSDSKGQPVFVFGAGGKSKALKYPDQTFEVVAKLKAETVARTK